MAAINLTREEKIEIFKTQKSYTDIEQSKKLVEILPLESADMYYPWYIEEDGDSIESGHRITTPNIGNFITHKVNKMILPCWSLAALLGVLPYPSLHKTFSGWRCDSYNKEGTSCILGESLDNPVDACYKMIVRLNELNLL